MSRVAFYAPLKPPYHPTPSGDRTLARLLLRGLAEAGFETELASGFRSYDGAGDASRQQRLRQIGERHAARLITRYQRRPADLRPRLWLTYHLYHKAPDWIGPAVCRALDIPYVVIEASYAAKQQRGPWQLGLEASATAIRQAALALCLNPRDRGGLARLAPALPLADLAPFIDTTPWLATTGADKATLAACHGLDPDVPWLISVAMMRPGDKLRSYQLLADAVRRLQNPAWELLIVGAGEAQADVHAAFRSHPRCHFLGQRDTATLAPLLQASDLLLWPAVNEAFGMALLEAQAAGCAVIAGREGGVESVVGDGLSGRLTPARDSDALAQAIEQLLAAPVELRRMQLEARNRVVQRHSLESAALALRQILSSVSAAKPG